MGIITDILFPKERIFLKMLNDAADNSMRGVIVFSEFINKFPSLNKEQKKEYLNKIDEIEGKGDRIIHALHERLNNALITPIDKEDIHELSTILDDIIDLVHSATKQIVLYELKKVDKCILELTRIINEGAREVVVLVYHLNKMKFEIKNSVRIHQLENQADEIYENAMAELYRGKNNAKELIKIKDIYFNLELVTDKIEDVSDVIQNVIIKHG